VVPTSPELALFNVVHYGLTMPTGGLPSTAARKDYSRGLATEAECRAALAACLAKGWLQLIDEAALGGIVDELRKGRFLGPIYGLPGVGGIDFTETGAALWRRHSGRGPHPDKTHPSVFTDVVHSKTSRYFRSRKAALAGIEEAKQWGEVVSVTGPYLIGPWRAQWWRWFPEGYRIDVEERMQWQGRIGQGEGCSLTRPDPQKSDPLRLQHVLDCHNISLAEWLLLASIDSGRYTSASHLPRWAAESAGEEWGVAVSDEACRGGLDACLRNGWLRAVDQQSVEEVQALLRDEPARMPVPSEVGGPGEIDFTPCGAALYRMIAAEYLGPDWEDGLSV